MEDESRRRRGWDVDSPRRTSRGCDAALWSGRCDVATGRRCSPRNIHAAPRGGAATRPRRRHHDQNRRPHRYDYVARAATINCVLLALLGLLFRLVALAALSGTNRDRMGLRSPAHVFYDAYAALAGGVGRWWRRPRKVGSTAAELPSLGGAPAGERRGLLAVATVRNGGGAVV